MNSANVSWIAMPHPTVRQFTRRRSGESAATIAMKQTMPSDARSSVLRT